MLNNNKISGIYILANPVIYKFRSWTFVAKRYVLHLKRNCKDKLFFIGLFVCSLLSFL